MLYKSLVPAAIAIASLSACSLTPYQDNPANAPVVSSASSPYTPVSTPDITLVSRQQNDLWVQLATDMRLGHVSHPNIDRELSHLIANPDYLHRITQRARPFMYPIMQELKQRNLPGELAALPVVESAFKNSATSHRKAAGMWQIMPATGKHLGLRQDKWYDGRRDLHDSTDAALDYLEYLNEYFDGDWLLAMAAYNAGEGRVGRAVKANEKAGKPTDFWSLDLPRETRAYVPKILAVSRVIQNPQSYGHRFEPLPEGPRLVRVPVNGKTTLRMAAQMAGMSVNQVKRYNAALRKGITPPDGRYALLLPNENAFNLQQKLSNVSASSVAQISQWQAYQINQGDTLLGISRRHGMKLATLRDVNGLQGDNLRLGDSILVPLIEDSGDTQYVVTKGDNLYAIGRRLGVSHNDLASWNGLKVGGVLKPGQQLDVKDGKGNSAGNNMVQTTMTVNYPVRSGDSLRDISNKFRVSIADLRKWNTMPEWMLQPEPGTIMIVRLDVLAPAQS